ncbi:thiaminase II [Beijerinckia indica]|uniref:Aminopyrimidine aminohydrolase n=1 Tax=Beijerinckia indica subsp. indica (strain ATCC 9039 / DSM 1715 / NCIMB 8712) TaxID=395963 RepID=B2IJ91_BEII9|nr:thiaminase II [Beijerinckia indica]ACB94851.1 transcriptional activator, TenA family [Beijerinckia indica subsp. indica ATCC 9039]
MAFDHSSSLSFVEGTFFARLRAAAPDEWATYVDHPFVHAMADGTLDPARFRTFLIQDYLYLLNYARAYALAVYKSESLDEMRECADIVSAILNTEMTMHFSYCDGWGITRAEMEAQPAAPELMAYCGFILDRAQAGDLLDLLVALSACLVGYGEIGLRLTQSKTTVREGNPYYSWMCTYADTGYQDLVRVGLARLDTVAARRGGEARLPELTRLFATTVRMETAFWLAGQPPMVTGTN